MRPVLLVFALSRHFAPRPEDGHAFVERMTVRVAPLVAESVRLYRHSDELVKRVVGLEAGAARIPGAGLAAALVVSIVLVLIAPPEALGDRLFDPKPSRVLHVSVLTLP